MTGGENSSHPAEAPDPQSKSILGCSATAEQRRPQEPPSQPKLIIMP